MRTLFISCFYPADKTYTQGTYQRMGRFIRTLGKMGEVNVLFYVPAHLDCSDSVVAEKEKELSALWQIKISLTLCKLSTSESNSILHKRVIAFLSKWDFLVKLSLENWINWSNV
jgi:hypothetical protein